MPPEPTGPVYSVRLEPHEPLLFGDNRAARAGLDHLQVDQDPSPLTVHGAIGRLVVERAASGTTWPDSVLGERQRDMLRPTGPVAHLLGYCLEDGTGRLLFPRPRHLRCRRGHRHEVQAIDLLSPEAAQGARASTDLPMLLLATEEEDEIEDAIWLSETALEQVLTGELPEAGLYGEDEIFRSEPRPGIAIENGRGQVREGHFFTRPYRRFRPAALDPAEAGGTAYRAWYQTLGPLARLPAAGTTWFLGGDRRRVRCDVREVDGHGRRGALGGLLGRVEEAAAASRGFFLYLLTPAIVDSSAPGPVTDLVPVAAAVGKPRFASGWDVHRRQPRELVALVPEGSVFFFEWSDGADRMAVVRERWLRPLGELGAAAGFGRALVGVWG